MSTDIQTGNLPVNIKSSSSHRNSKMSEQTANTPPTQAEPIRSVDTVSITNEGARLQRIENQLASIPSVNDAKVAEIKQAIADGSFKIDSESIASKLIEMESGILNNENT